MSGTQRNLECAVCGHKWRGAAGDGCPIVHDRRAAAPTDAEIGRAIIDVAEKLMLSGGEPEQGYALMGAKARELLTPQPASPPPEPEWMTLAKCPDTYIHAIRAHRGATGSDLKAAKDAVDAVRWGKAASPPPVDALEPVVWSVNDVVQIRGFGIGDGLYVAEKWECMPARQLGLTVVLRRVTPLPQPIEVRGEISKEITP